MNSVKKAIKLFTTAQCYSPAIQLAKVSSLQASLHDECVCVTVFVCVLYQEHGLESDLMGLALMGSQVDKIDAAQ